MTINVITRSLGQRAYSRFFANSILYDLPKRGQPVRSISAALRCFVGRSVNIVLGLCDPIRNTPCSQQFSKPPKLTKMPLAKCFRFLDGIRCFGETSSVNETAACFMRSTQSRTLTSRLPKRERVANELARVPEKCSESKNFGVHLVSVFGTAAS